MEKTIQYPVKIIGTRKAGRSWFYSWDLNIAFMRDYLNPDFFLTFEDAAGKVQCTPISVTYSCRSLALWHTEETLSPGVSRQNLVLVNGLVGLILMYQTLSHSSLTLFLQNLKFDQLPKSFAVTRGFDGGCAVMGTGIAYSNFTLTGSHLEHGLKLQYLGTGNVFGLTKVGEGQFVRLPYLFKPKWGPKELILYLSPTFFWILMWILGFGALKSGTSEE
jgi:hypothetical protein